MALTDKTPDYEVFVHPHAVIVRHQRHDEGEPAMAIARMLVPADWLETEVNVVPGGFKPGDSLPMPGYACIKRRD